MSSPVDPSTEALQQLLAAQHAAIYGYPLIGSRLTDQTQIDRARTLEAAHLLTRDALRGQLASRGASPVAAQASYQPVEPITDPAGAQRWAIQLEAACAAGYRYLLSSTGASTGQLRGQALAGLVSAAEDGTRWRLLVEPSTPTVPFPGL
ncbi:MAG: ferritin-like domain-containing protein [Jatrophihabitantaceae bacterium]